MPTQQTPAMAEGTGNKPNASKEKATARSRDRSKGTPKTTKHTEEKDEAWNCEICENIFTELNARLLECQRCKKHYCIKCLNKTVTEYNMLEKSDSMWFCYNCRIVVEKNIVTDLKIEERCKEIMTHYEERITNLEGAMGSKCDEERVREIMAEELNKSTEEERVKSIVTEEIKKTGEMTTGRIETAEEIRQEVMNEINNRKAREKNIIIYGGEEEVIESRVERIEADMKFAKEVLQECGVEVDEGTIANVTRLGQYIADVTVFAFAFDFVESLGLSGLTKVESQT